jgi:hypothetical protein
MLQFDIYVGDNFNGTKIPEEVKVQFTEPEDNFSAKLMHMLRQVSNYMFCLTAIMFLLVHPSVLMLPVMPALILAMIMPNKNIIFSWVSKILVAYTAPYILTLVCYQLYWLLQSTAVYTFFVYGK